MRLSMLRGGGCKRGGGEGKCGEPHLPSMSPSYLSEHLETLHPAGPGMEDITRGSGHVLKYPPPPRLRFQGRGRLFVVTRMRQRLTAWEAFVTIIFYFQTTNSLVDTTIYFDTEDTAAALTDIF
jgi:hypothetical protein